MNNCYYSDDEKVWDKALKDQFNSLPRTKMVMMTAENHERMKALAGMVIVREEVECDCGGKGLWSYKEGDNHSVWKQCPKCHGSGYTYEVKPGGLLEVCIDMHGQLEIMEVVDEGWDGSIAEAKKLGGLE